MKSSFGHALSLTVLLLTSTRPCAGLRSTHTPARRPLVKQQQKAGAPTVLRLNRYEQADPASMVEAKARVDLWSSKNQVGGMKRSARQTSGLRAHHLEVLASASSLALTSKAYYRQAHPETIKLSDLFGSQYVGAIGLGEKVTPEGCQVQEGAAAHATQPGACQVEPESVVWVVFDTGSTNFWVCSDLAASTSACKKPGRNFYDHSKSRTYRQPEYSEDIKVEFGTGKVVGPLAEDTMHVGHLKVTKQTFGMIQKEEGKVFAQVPFDGICGLAFPGLSAHHEKPFFDRIIEQEALDQNVFALYLSLTDDSANALILGGIDSRFSAGDIKYFEVTDPWYWAIDLLRFSIGDEDFTPREEEDCHGVQHDVPKAIVDTGTTFFTAGTKDIVRLLKKLPVQPCSSITDESHPPLTFKLKSQSGEEMDYKLRWYQYMVKDGEGEDASCVPAFMRIDIPCRHGPGMILSEVWTRHFFTVFDRKDGIPTNAQVGFAPAAAGETADPLVLELTKGQRTFDPTNQFPAAA